MYDAKVADAALEGGPQAVNIEPKYRDRKEKNMH